MIIRKTKRLLFFIATTLFSFNTFSQQYQVPNSQFETFEQGFNGVGQQPTGWKASNVSMSSPASVSTVLVNSDQNGRTGNCVYLHNEESGAMGITKPASAYISLGKPWAEVQRMSANASIGGTEGGLQFTYRPDSLSVWVKRTYSSQENARIVVYLWAGTAQGSSYMSRGNGCLGKSVTNDETDIRGRNGCTTTQQATFVGNGEWSSNQQIQNWQEIKVPITYFNNTKPQMMNVIISSANYPLSLTQQNLDQNSYRSGSKMWADDLKLIYSSKIHELRVNNRPITGFDPNQTTYTVSLGQGVTAIPSIKAFRSGRELGSASGLNSEIHITNGQVDGEPTTIKVNAEDGSSTTTYTIYFVSQQSSNSRPVGININGDPLPQFNGYLTSYNYQLPYGTTECPQITVDKAEDSQTVDIDCQSVPGIATVKVTAQDGSQTIYTITLTVEALSDNTLQGIKVNGYPIDNFNPTQNNYTVNLPIGTTQVPVIEPISAYASGLQTITIASNTLDGGATITVSAPGNRQTRTYRITYIIAASSNSHLSGIRIDGQDLQGFQPNQFDYQYDLPIGTTQLPAITWTLGEASQQASLTTNGVNGEARILVTAQNGSTSLYKIQFSVRRSQNSKLQSIKLDGVSIAGFHPDTLIYNITLPSGTTQMPTITYDKGDQSQTVRLSQGSIGGQTTLRVTAEDPAFVTIYTLNISTQISAAATLMNIFIDGVALEEFEENKFNYSYILPETATSCPTITVEKSSAGQKVYIAKPQLEGTASIEVKPETNDQSNIYTIRFGKALSNNNFLTSISINGEAIADFSTNNTDYMVDLNQSEQSPVVTYTKADTTCRVVWVDKGLDGTELIAIAENGEKQIYKIGYRLPLNTTTSLSDLLVYSKESRQFAQIADFSSDQYEYIVTLPWREKYVPSLYPVADNEKQKIEIRYGKIGQNTLVKITSENGDTLTYKILFQKERSNVSTLNAIYTDGNLIDQFSPDITDYRIMLPYGTTKLPKITFERGLQDGTTVISQRVTISTRPLGDTTFIQVEAENGDTSIYSLYFDVEEFSTDKENILQSILIGGVGIDGYNPTDSIFAFALPYGSTEVPDITFVKNYEEQTVIVEKSYIEEQVKIFVLSNVSGVADKTYTINLSVAHNPVSLRGIKSDGIDIAGFSPDKYTYILPISTLPTLTYDYDQAGLSIVEDKNHKRVIVRVESLNDNSKQTTYTVYFYYTTDVIPNGDFEQWSATAYQGKEKPTGWMSGLDVIDRGDAQGTISKETSEKTSGSFSAYMRTTYNSATYWNPGLLTLGSFQFNASYRWWPPGYDVSVPISGGVDFRNTPDSVYMDYRYDTNGHEDKMSLDVQLWKEGVDFSSSQAVANIHYEDNSSSSEWKKIAKSVVYNQDEAPKRMNIIISSTDITHLYGNFPLTDMGRLYADNLRFSYSSLLKSIKVNGEDLQGFSSSVFEYDLQDFDKSTIKIEVEGEVADQEHTISISEENEQLQRIATITSKAEDGSQSIYTIRFARQISQDSYLSNIFINDTVLEDFNKEDTAYTIAADRIGSIAVIKSSEKATVQYELTEAGAKIIVTAENGNKRTYYISLIDANRSAADINSIAVEGYDIQFSTETSIYEVNLGEGVVEIPQITVETLYGKQSFIVDFADTTNIKVQSADHTTERGYQIIFHYAPEVLTDSLKSISLDGVALSSFTPDTLDYIVSYNAEREKLSFEADSYSIVETFSGDTIALTVGEKRYTVICQKQLSDNSYLQNIFIYNSVLPDFRPDSMEYQYIWNSEVLPDIHILSSDSHQTTQANYLGSTVEIDVTAENQSAESLYTINFSKNNASANSLLLGISYNDTAIEDFSPSQTSYTITLPEGTTQMPDLIFVKGNEGQSIDVYTQGMVATVIVTAEDGLSKITYTITFNVPLSDNALLSAIFVGGEELTGFSANVFDYSYTLPYGTTELPAIEYEKGHAGQVVVESSQGVNGVYTLKVTSESGLVEQEYIISFSVEKSTNSRLESIKVDGMPIIYFNPDIFEYTVDVPYGSTEVPEVSAIKQDSTQTVTIIPAATLQDTTIVKVEAEDAQSVSIYRISFVILKSDNAYLQDIFIDGESLRENADNHRASKDFYRQEYWYDVIMPYGIETSPAITWQGEVADYDTIYASIEGSLADTIDVKITVVSQDRSNTNDYFLSIYREKSSNSRLADLRIDGVTIEGFYPDTVYYHIQHPVHSDTNTIWITSEQVSWTLGEPNQSVSISEGDNHTLIITVKAEDGVSTTIYIITQERLLSDNALLSDISVDGTTIPDFSPDRFDYVYILPFASSQIPDVTYRKGEDEQTVDLSTGFVGEKTYIYVTAEDGTTTSEYSILFRVSEDNPGEFPTAEDVCFSRLSEDSWKATSKRNNVEIMIVDETGRLVFRGDVPLSDPNDELCSSAVYQSVKLKKNTVYIFSFVYNKKKIIHSGKFIN